MLKLHPKSTATQLKLGDSRVFQQDNDPKHQNWFWNRQTNIKLLQWPFQIPELNPT